MSNKGKQFYEFSVFRIDPYRRLLLREKQPLALQSKAFDVLLALVQNHERIVSKDELLKMVWPETFVEESNLAQHIFVLRKVLGDSIGENRYIVTIPGRGYRFAENVQVVKEEDSPGVRPQLPQVEEPKAVPTAAPTSVADQASSTRSSSKRWLWLPAVALLLVITLLIARKMLKAAPLREADLVLVSDFVNTTGEPIFDDTLKQALTVKLAESPYYTVALDAQTRRSLGLMQRSTDERVVGPLAREVCEREGAKAVIAGSIVRVGSKYALSLDASSCLTGDSLAHEQIEAENQEQVLRQLGQIIVPMRRTLGESLSYIQRFDTPIEQATTKSLPALKAYTDGDRKRAQGKDGESIPSYKMAIELDPEFAIAYARLGVVYDNMQQAALADENLRKAFERREHISEREKFYIQAHYYEDSTFESDKAIETYDLWTKVYPHDWIPFNNLCNDNLQVGNTEAAIAAGQQALRLNPNHGFPYATLTLAYVWDSRFAEAKAVAQQATTQKLDGSTIHRLLHQVALIEGDEKSAEREREWEKGDALEGMLIYQDASYTLSLGQVRAAHALFDRARKKSLERQPKELAGAITQDEAQYLADIELSSEARTLSDQALRMMPDSPERKAYAALAFATVGDFRRMESLAAEASKARPSDFLMNNVTLPLARAIKETAKKNPAGAIAELQPVAPYDFSDPSKGVTAYYRGNAFLQMRAGKEAAAEFQKILDHRGAATFHYWSLAHLGLARAYALSGEKEKSRVAYREFLELWKSADPDVPLLKQAKAGYAKLQ
jgi:DNA-binding winged helix-turn-helix (wHTH) protein/tetratricopeptide (TPR) repeat protein